LRLERLEPRLVLFKSWLTLEPNHETITGAALWFLKEDVLDTISLQHAVEELVQGLNSAAHFDNCNFRQSAARINDLYASAIRAADPNHFDSDEVAEDFGKLLHPVQDFYSHSNWVDDGQTTIIDGNNDRPWDPLDAYSIHDGAMILQGHNPDPFGNGSLQRNGFVVTVRTPDGGVYRGVITGTFGFSDDCPTSVAVPHGSLISPHCLNKDGPNEYNGRLYAPAADLAVVQTSNEFDRLVNMVQATYGTAQHLLDAWIGSGGAPHGTGSWHAPPRTLDQAVSPISQADFPRLFKQEIQRRGYVVPPQLLDALTSDDIAVRQKAVQLLHSIHGQAPAADNPFAAIAAGFSSFALDGLNGTALLDGHILHSGAGGANLALGDVAGLAYGHGPGMGPGVSALLHGAGGPAHEYLVNPPFQGGIDHKPG
jgi:hypothetical protein